MTQKILLGTYTKRDSKGIYSIELDTDNKKLGKLTEEVHIESPTYLSGNSDYSLLFSVAKNENGEGGIASYALGETNKYEALDAYYAEGAPPCYVSYDEGKQLVYTANYHKGEVSVFETNGSGGLHLLDSVTHTGKSVHENQKSPHAHYFDFTPDHQYIIACDLGTDEIITYSLSSDRQLEQVDVISVTPGTGPRHITFHPNEKIAYVVGELSSDVLTFSYDKENGTLSYLQTLSSIPEDHTEFNGGAAIRISSDGKFLYSSNRGHDSLAVYSVAENGLLDLIEYVPTEGKTPRDFNIDSTESFIVVAHQDSDNLTLFERDSLSGRLTLIEKDVYAPEAICVQFVK